MATEKKGKPQEKDEQLKNLPPKPDQDVVGGKHPAKVTVPDVKF